MRLIDLVPSATDLLSLEVEEVAGALLVHLNSRGEAQLFHHGFFAELRRNPQYGEHQKEVNDALMEAWEWLVREGLLARKASADHSHYFITRRGKRMKSREDVEAYRKANLLPKGQIHPVLAMRVYPAFLRGEYDTAVFQAFREVEVAVRAAANFGSDAYGTEMMRAAFKPADGKGQSTTPGFLTDAQLPVAEQHAMANLFAGAIGLYKNPQSHRHVATHPEEAAEQIVFASQLLRIVDAQRFRVLQEMGAPLDGEEPQSDY
jgi:uncharacterized protein (TIGR02391 family)